MIFPVKKIAVEHVPWLAACALFVLSGLYFLNRSSALHQRGALPQWKTAQILSQESTPSAPALHINGVLLHGHIVEIEGSTDAGAVVMINGQTAPTIFGGNTFRHFVGPLPAGTTIITVTSQDEQGGVNTQQIAATID